MNKSVDHKVKNQADSFIDITSDTCPMTFVKTKLKLEKMESGQILEVLLNEGEPLKNVPLSAEELGHTILSVCAEEAGEKFRIYIQKA